ncbi:leiomodin-1 [Protopterus annectens]|uniref:leiomodin-1 n=1 Tax=Protopterus annectens TaxID=7888 RepID=UPI001CFAC39A|nr:leiomodin-1 [Protopterus annectens]
MSRKSKCRRQVSEDPDIDHLLATLSPEEMEELEKELDVTDNPSSIPVWLKQRNQTEKCPVGLINQGNVLSDCEKGSNKIIPTEKAVKEDKVVSSNTDACKEARSQSKSVERVKGYDPERGKKKEDCCIKVDEIGKTEHLKNTAEKPKEEKCLKSNEKENVVKSSERKTTEEKCPVQNQSTRDAGKDKACSELRKINDDTQVIKSVTKDQNTDPENDMKTPLDYLTNQNRNGKVEENDDAASSIFDEALEQVRNNDPQLIEVNVNNSDAIKTDTLIHFAEALCGNTVVKTFALANTRADDHVAFAIASMLRRNKTITSLNLDSNHLTGKGIIALIRALQYNSTLTELRFHNQRHICGGKTEMEIAKLLKENTTLLKLGYHFELAGPRMTVVNLLSRNMDKQRQRRLQEQKQAQDGEKKNSLEVPKVGLLPKGSPKPSPLPSPKTSPWSSPKCSPKVDKGPAAPAPPPPPPPPLAPPLNDNIKNSLSPASVRRATEKSSRDQLLAAIRTSNIKQLKKVEVPKLLR